jgi:hypothetical protein
MKEGRRKKENTVCQVHCVSPSANADSGPSGGLTNSIFANHENGEVPGQKQSDCSEDSGWTLVISSPVSMHAGICMQLEDEQSENKSKAVPVTGRGSL